MATVSMTGSDTIKINNRILADLGDGDVAALTFPNDIAVVKTGKNGNSIYGLNESGRQCEIVLRVVRGSGDDKFLNNLLAQQNNDFAGFVLMIGELTKRVGDGTGNVQNDIYILSGGVFSKQTEAKSNVEGDTEQSLSVYHMKFANAPRVIG
jgi:hypothetical protein